MAKINIPDELKADIPQTVWGKMLAATPIVMTVLATMLAGLASSEMTKAQYDRSLAAQQQSKAGDQWSFFQAKKLRSATQLNAQDLLLNTGELCPLNQATLKISAELLPAQVSAAEAEARQLAPALAGPRKDALDQYLQNAPQRLTLAEQLKKDILAALETEEGRTTLTTLQEGRLPALPAAIAPDPQVQTALQALDEGRTDAEIAPLFKGMKDASLDIAIRQAKDRAAQFDALTTPVNKAIAGLEKLLVHQTTLLQDTRGALLLCGVPARPGASALRDYTAARLRFTALRYDTEARLNQAIASLYELQVRKNNQSAERHHRRSQRFFYGMLAGQMAVIISTFAMAARKRNLLWSIAAAAGAAAVSFGIYVYLCV